MNRAVTTAAVTLLAGAFAMALGMTVGAGDQRQYLLHGLHAVDPTLWPRDWFVTQTVPHHTAFVALIRTLAMLGPIEITLGLANGVINAMFAAALYLLVRRATPHAVPAAALLLLAMFFHPGPDLGWSRWTGGCLLPSSIGLVAFVGAIAAAAYGRIGWTGLLFGVGGLFHANFLLLSLPVLSAVAWTAGVHRQPRRALLLFTPVALALCAHLPFMLVMTADRNVAAAARTIFFDIYVPQHFRPWTWGPTPFLKFGAAVIVAWIAGRGLPFGREARAAALTGFALVMLGIIFTALIPLDIVAQVYPYRLASLVTLFAYMALSIRVVDGAAAAGARILSRTPSPAGARTAGARIPSRTPSSATRSPIGSRLNVISGATAFIVAGFLFRAGLWRNDLLTLRTRPSQAALFDFCRVNTPPRALFVVPPHLREFRLGARRSIAIDFKCMPYLPVEQLEWFRRMTLVAGRPFADENDAIAAFRALDRAAARRLAADFNAEYLVTESRDHQGDLAGLRCVYFDQAYRVFRLDAVPVYPGIVRTPVRSASEDEFPPTVGAPILPRLRFGLVEGLRRWRFGLVR